MNSLLTLLPDEEHWLKFQFAGTLANGHEFRFRDWNTPNANCFCFLGALFRTTGKPYGEESSPMPEEAQRYYMIAREVIIEKFRGRVSQEIKEEYSQEYHNCDCVVSVFNDHPRTTYEDVVSVIRETEKRLVLTDC